jgi:hypothetical protein
MDDHLHSRLAPTDGKFSPSEHIMTWGREGMISAFLACSHRCTVEYRVLVQNNVISCWFRWSLSSSSVSLADLKWRMMSGSLYRLASNRWLIFIWTGDGFWPFRERFLFLYRFRH